MPSACSVGRRCSAVWLCAALCGMQVAEAVEVWAHLRNAPMRRRWADDPEPKPPSFPLLMVRR